MVDCLTNQKDEINLLRRRKEIISFLGNTPSTHRFALMGDICLKSLKEKKKNCLSRMSNT
jgi:hypothetical protein